MYIPKYGYTKMYDLKILKDVANMCKNDNSNVKDIYCLFNDNFDINICTNLKRPKRNELLNKSEYSIRNISGMIF